MNRLSHSTEQHAYADLATGSPKQSIDNVDITPTIGSNVSLQLQQFKAFGNVNEHVKQNG